MGLKYKFTEIFRSRFPAPQILYNQLEDLQNQIDGKDTGFVIKKNVKLNKTNLKKAFGDPSKFNGFGVVQNKDGTYLVISDDKGFKFIAFEDI